MFLVEEYLKWQLIPYHIRGANCCLICPNHSIGKHATNLDVIFKPNTIFDERRKEYFQPGTFSCWVCKAKGGPFQLIQLLSKTNTKQTQEILQKFSTDGTEIYYTKPIEEPKTLDTLEFFPCFEPTWEEYNAGTEYLENRGYTIYDAKEWNILYANMEKCKSSCPGIESKHCFKYRVIFPHYDKFGKLLCWQGRDITNDSGARYKSLKTELAVAKTKHTFFGTQLLRGLNTKTLVLAEGPMDAFRWGKGALAKTGTKLTLEQINLMIDLFDYFEFEKLIIFPDPPDKEEVKLKVPLKQCKGYKGALDDATQLCSFIDSIGIAPAFEYDLGDMTKEEAIDLFYLAEEFN